MLNRISKPHIVDFLRMSDRNRWLSPRIRYASVRSKPELIQDLENHFCVKCDQDLLLFEPKRSHNLPAIVYCLRRRLYLINGDPMDVPRVSRKKPSFCILREKVTLTF